MQTAQIVEEARERLKGVLVIDFVVPDYYAKYPKPCMGGWGRGIVNITPSARCCPATPPRACRGSSSTTSATKPLAEIWLNGQAFQKYRGTDWMKEPCRSCPRREIDFGGCRCQALGVLARDTPAKEHTSGGSTRC